MKRFSCKSIFLGLIALGSIWVSLFFLQRHFNFYLLHIKESRDLITQCELTDSMIVRAYTSHGSSVTTSDLNSVYIQNGLLPFERCIWAAYSSPSIEEVLCEEKELTIITTADEPEYASYVLSLEQIRTELVHQPIRLSYGERETPEEVELRNKYDQIEFFTGSSCLSFGIFLAIYPFVIRPQLLKKRNANKVQENPKR